MGKRTVTAHLNPLSARFQIRRITRTVCPDIQRTVAEQAVEALRLLRRVTWKVFTFPVAEKLTVPPTADFFAQSNQPLNQDNQHQHRQAKLEIPLESS